MYSDVTDVRRSVMTQLDFHSIYLGARRYDEDVIA